MIDRFGRSGRGDVGRGVYLCSWSALAVLDVKYMWYLLIPSGGCPGLSRKRHQVDQDSFKKSPPISCAVLEGCRLNITVRHTPRKDKKRLVRPQMVSVSISRLRLSRSDCRSRAYMPTTTDSVSFPKNPPKPSDSVSQSRQVPLTAAS